MKKKTRGYSIACSKEEFHFANAKSFVAAANIVLDDMLHKRVYQHYCQLDSILGKILQRRWYLTRCSSSRLNDLHEPQKFAGKTKFLYRTYVMCFGHSRSESAAMWGLYGKNNPFALRVTIPGNVLEDWMLRTEVRACPGNDGDQAKTKRRNALKEMDVKDGKGQSLEKKIIQSAIFRDVLYASVASEDKRDEYDIKRGNRVSWRRAFYNLQDCDDVLDGLYAGFLKDAEWAYEMESRLCISMKKEIDDDYISVAVPKEVIAAMRFTFSPWLKLSDETHIRQILEAALKGTGIDLDDKTNRQRFRRSVLQGALNFK